MPCLRTLKQRSLPGRPPRAGCGVAAADASHELRTPLVTIRGFSELYRHGALATPEDVATAMGRIESEAKRMGSMVEDLLLLARLDEQRPLQQKPADLQLIANDAVVDTQASDRCRVISLTGLDGGTPRPRAGPGRRSQAAPGGGQSGGQRPALHPRGQPDRTRRGRPERERWNPVRHRGPRPRPGISTRTPPGSSSGSTGRHTSRTRETGGSGLGLATWPPSWARTAAASRKTDGGGATLVVSLPAWRKNPRHGDSRCP